MNKIVLGKSTLPNLKNIKSKVGSMINTNYKVGVDSHKDAQGMHNLERAQSHLESLFSRAGVR